MVIEAHSARECPGRIVMFTIDRQIDRRILREAESLIGDGWRVTVVAMPQAGPDDPSYVHRLGNKGELVDEVREAKLLRFYQKLRGRGIFDNRWNKLARMIAWRFFWDPISFYQRMYEKEEKTLTGDVFVAHDLPMLPVASRAAQRQGGVLVYDSHELFAEQGFYAWEAQMWTNIESGYIGKCDAVITVNESIAQELEKRYGLSHVYVVRNAEKKAGAFRRKTEYFHHTFSLPLSARILLYQGGVISNRNLQTLVKGMEYLRDRDIHLVLLGDGESKPELERLAKVRGLADIVHFHHAVPQDELLGYTAAADAGIIPYQATCLNNMYCTPNKLFEYIIANVPIIATELPEITRILEGYGIGLVGDTSTPRNIANLIEQLFDNEKAYEDYRDAVGLASDRINWEHEQSVLLDVYRGLHEGFNAKASGSIAHSPLRPIA